jgi:hypothetical protein
MLVTIDYLKTFVNVDVLIRAKIEDVSSIVGKKLNCVDLLYGSKDHMLVNIYYNMKDQTFDFKYENIIIAEILILFETKVEEEMIAFLNKLNTIEYTIEDLSY